MWISSMLTPLKILLWKGFDLFSKPFSLKLKTEDLGICTLES